MKQLRVGYLAVLIVRATGDLVPGMCAVDAALGEDDGMTTAYEPLLSVIQSEGPPS